MHEEFEAFLDSVAPQPDLVEKVADFLIEEVKENQAELAARSTRRKKRAEQLDRELQALIRMRAQDLITDQEFMRQRRLVRDQRTALEANTSGHSIDVAEVREKFREIAAPLVQLKQTWHTIHPPSRRRFERLLLPAGFVIGQTRTAELGVLFTLFRRFAAADSSGVPHACVRSNPIVAEIQGFWGVLQGIEEETRTPRWRFRCSHRNRPPMR
jgi:hypothetical protein